MCSARRPGPCGGAPPASRPARAPGPSSPRASKTVGQHRPVGAQHGPLSRPSTSSLDDLARTAFARGVLLAEPVRRSRASSPVASAYGVTVCTQRVLDEVDQPGDVVRRQQRHQPLGLVLARLAAAGAPVVARARPCGSAPGRAAARPGPGSCVRTLARLVERLAVAGVGQPLRAPRRAAPTRPRRSRRWRGSRSRRRRPPPGRPSSGPASCRAADRVALAAPAAGRAGRRSPVSSATSRTAAAAPCSPGSSLPLGKDQSSYLGRWTSSTSRAWPEDDRAGSDARPTAGAWRLVSHHRCRRQQESRLDDRGMRRSVGGSSCVVARRRGRRRRALVAGRPPTDLERAVAHGARATRQRLSWTDWAGVRGELDARPRRRPVGRDRRRPSSSTDGFEADLTSTSALVESAAVMQERLRLLPGDRRLGAVQPVGGGRRRHGAAFRSPPTSTTLADGLESAGLRRPDDGHRRLGGRRRPARRRSAA